MAEYIDKQAFNDAIIEAIRRYPNTFHNGLETARRIAHNLPAADVAPVVRCKDCEIRQYCKVAQYLGADGFCSNGAQMDGGDPDER